LKIFGALTFISSFNHDKMKKLIDYITVMPDESSSHDVGHK